MSSVHHVEIQDVFDLVMQNFDNTINNIDIQNQFYHFILPYMCQGITCMSCPFFSESILCLSQIHLFDGEINNLIREIRDTKDIFKSRCLLIMLKQYVYDHLTREIARLGEND